MEAFKYRIITEWSDEDRVFVARVPALGPGCAAHGDSPERAAKEVQVAAGLMLDILRDDGAALPPSDATADYSGQLRLRLPKSLHERVTQLAAADDSSVNTTLVALISESLGRRSGGPAAPRAKRSAGDKSRPRKMDSYLEELGGKRK